MPRILEIIFATLLVGLFSPLLLIAAIAVRLGSPGPVIFRHRRIGMNELPFEVFKFRSMVQSQDYNRSSLTVGGDARITSVGRILRATKIDELPQLFNVLRGDMSIVGPRPETEELLAYYPPKARAIMLSIRPGITDPASIEFRNEESELAAQEDPHSYYCDVLIRRKCKIYEEYIPQKSFWFDFKTVAGTIVAVLDMRRWFQ